MLKGQAKKNWQREYMKDYMRKKRVKTQPKSVKTQEIVMTHGCGCKKGEERLCSKHGRY